MASPENTVAPLNFKCEWLLFPILAHIHRQKPISTRRAVLTLIVATIVHWFAVHVFLAVGTTAHISLLSKVLSGLDMAVTLPANWAAGGSEFNVLMSIFFGSIWCALLIELLWARLLLRGRLPHDDGNTWGNLLRAVLLGTQSWAIYWFAYTLLFAGCGGEGSVFLFWSVMLIPAAVIIIATTIQAATLSQCIYMQRSSATSTTTSPVGWERPRTSFPWIKHL
ncbi:hypothetical protein LCGC14_2318580, partial [marine sediment metagenome]